MEVQENVDRGWAFVVLIAAFLLRFLTNGTAYTFGVMYTDLLTDFQASPSATATVGSIQPALMLLTGVFCEPLIKRLGWLKLTIVGALISTTGFGSSALAPNIYFLYCTYGALVGIGHGFMYMTSMVAVQHYFDKYRALATSFAVSGSGVGQLCFSQITRALLSSVGWRWTLCIQGAVMLLGIVCALAFRPVNESSHESNVNIEDSTENSSILYQRKSSSGQSIEENESMNILNKSAEYIEQQTTCGSKVKEAFLLFRNPIYSIFCFTILMFCFAYIVQLTFIPERAITYGVQSHQAATLISFVAIANISSRVIFSWFANRSPTIRYYLGTTALTLGGIISSLIKYFTTYPQMVAFSILFGASSGIWTGIYPVLMVDYMGVENIVQTLGQCLAIGSIAYLVASPLAGVIIEKTNGDYNIPIMVFGIAQTVGGLAFFGIKILQKYSVRYTGIYESFSTMQPAEEPITHRRRRYTSQSLP